MAHTIYGPDGQAISVIGGTPLSTSQALQRIDHDAMNEAVMKHFSIEEVAKRVKAQGTTLSQVWDPSRGKPKPTSVTYETLRTIARRNEWIRAIIKTRKNQIGAAGWTIIPKDEQDDSPAVEALCEKVSNLFKRPSMHGSRPTSRSWRTFMNEVLEDILVLDQGCIEKEWTLDKWIAAMYPVDGATIAPNMDERGGYHDDAYVQTVDGQTTARFGLEDLIFIMDNPQTDVQFAGYGFSPLEGLIVSVTAELYASKYNASYFEKGTVPEGMINLGPEVSPEDVNAFRMYWMNEIMGRPWAIPIVGGGKAEWIPWRASNKDMEYMAYQQWLLKKMLAAYQMSPKELGIIEDVNRSTAEDATEQEAEKGIQPLLTLLSDYIEVEVIGEHGLGVGDFIKFRWDEAEESEDVLDQRYNLRVEKGAATRAEWREAVGMEPGESAGLDEYLTGEDLVALPATPEDVEAISPAAKAEQKAEEARERFAELDANGGGAGNATSEPAPEFEGGDTTKLSPQARAAVWGKSVDDMTRAELAYVASAARPLRKVFDQPNPQLLERQADAEEVFADASSELVTELEEILGLPLHKTVSLPQRVTLPLAELRVDWTYQRPEDREKVKSMYRRLRAGEELEGDVKVNEREDGSMWITDGQHRVKAEMLAGRTHRECVLRRDPQQNEQQTANLMTAHA